MDWLAGSLMFGDVTIGCGRGPVAVETFARCQLTSISSIFINFIRLLRIMLAVCWLSDAWGHDATGCGRGLTPLLDFMDWLGGWLAG